MNQVYILGIDHEIQACDSTRTMHERSKFTDLLRKLVADNNIGFIGEETFPEKNTIAKCVACVYGIRWEIIEMSRQARQALGIADEQKNQRQPFDDIKREPSKQVRVLSDGIREEYMLWRTLTMAGDSVNILVLCGMLHVGELERRFKNAQCQVKADSLCKYDWYAHSDCPDNTPESR